MRPVALALLDRNDEAIADLHSAREHSAHERSALAQLRERKLVPDRSSGATRG